MRNHTYAEKQFVILKRNGLSFLQQVQEIHISQQIRQQHFEQRKLKQMLFLMAKNNVDGVYSADPLKDKNAVKYQELSYLEVISQGLEVMDSTASTLCMDNDIPLVVFSIMDNGNIKRAVLGEPIGTVVRRNL